MRVTERITSLEICAYCGIACKDDKVYKEDQCFCCYGCATLNEVITNFDVSSIDVSLKYKQYDFPETFESLIDFQNQSIYGIHITLPAIHCSSCVYVLEDLPSLHSSIISSQVNFENKTCKLVVRKELQLSAIAQLLDNIGYPPQISVSQKQKIARGKEKQKNLMKLVVAGFCFGNIMLLSMPHYVGLDVAADPFFSQLFSYLSLVMVLPVIFYSGNDYLTSAYKSLLIWKAHINIPILIGIISLFLWSIYEIIVLQRHGYLDSLAGLIFFLLIGKWFQAKVYDYVSFDRTVSEFIPFVVRKKNGNLFSWTSIDQLNFGDQIIVKNEEIIPVNGTLSEGTGIIDYAFISGESECCQVSVSGSVYAGGRQKAGEIGVTLNEKPSIEKLWNTWAGQSKSEVEPPNFSDRVSKYFTISILTIACFSFLYWYNYHDTYQALFVFCSVLIVACPCALALSMPFTYGSILRVFNANQFYLKQPHFISRLSEIRHIVFDKTGTLTQQTNSKLEYIGIPLSETNQAKLKILSQQSSHPLSVLISNYLTSDCKYSIVDFKEHLGKGIEGVVNGVKVKLGSSTWLKDTKSNHTVIYASVDGIVLGFFQLKISFRKGLKDMLQSLGSFVKISILSGDNNGEQKALEKLFNHFESIEFNVSPESKAKKINQMKALDPVMMVGDGMNDSTAIATGDVGVAITENLNGFYPGSDAVLLANSFNKIHQFVRLARYSKHILNWSLMFSLIYNLTGIAFAVMGLLTPIIAAILMPLSSISVVVLVTSLVRLKSKQLNLI